MKFEIRMSKFETTSHFPRTRAFRPCTGGFPLPFGRGEGQGEGFAVTSNRAIADDENLGPLTPALSPSKGERENPAPSLFQGRCFLEGFWASMHDKPRKTVKTA